VSRPRQPGGPGRRPLLAAAAAALVAGPAWLPKAAAHGSFGPVQPTLPAPALPLQPVDGKRMHLPELLRGRVTAVQLMFTGCSATCPIQGALFAQVQQHLDRADAQLRLLSVSIDPLGDDAAALRTWLGRFGAQPPRWSAALPGMNDVDRLLDFLRGRAPGPDRHTTQAFVFDRRARLVYRTQDMPEPQGLVRLMQGVARRG
jgi:protein SCO1/2